MRPAHTAGTVSEPGLKGESSGVLMLISLSTTSRLDKLIKSSGRGSTTVAFGAPLRRINQVVHGKRRVAAGTTLSAYERHSSALVLL